MECLKGPALAVMKAARDSDPEVSPAQCLDAIESAFGSAETGNGHTNCAAKKSEVIAQKGDIPPGLIGPPSLVPIKVNVSGLAIWGLSDASYPYLRYVVVDMEFPENVTGVKKTITVLALICPSSPSPEQSPVILGTNANMFRRSAQLCQDTAGVDIGQTLGIQAKTSVSLPNQLTLDEEEDEVGSVKWMGPGSLNLPPGGECCAICEVELKRPVG
ncbi:hypothetical protein L3Q82_000402 [Scortum barcoo]|uniref:Uncharacterized protein n=1 Tax=Scortum barcoo TaxID=214431 RepID=A0ACB8XAS9_9TELE|nr:hypothetical protein L3Q82_000402 [Scortum barcoo]